MTFNPPIKLRTLVAASPSTLFTAGSFRIDYYTRERRTRGSQAIDQGHGRTNSRRNPRCSLMGNLTNRCLTTFPPHTDPIFKDSFNGAARVAQRLYAPLGTELSLGEYVRLTQRFVDLFAHKKRRLSTPVKERKSFNFEIAAEWEGGFVQRPDDVTIEDDDVESIDQLAKDLKVPRPPFILFIADDGRHIN